MAEYSLLPKAPIKEALIDIRVKIKDGINSEIFLQLYDNISNQYPKKTTRHKREGKIEFKKVNHLLQLPLIQFRIFICFFRQQEYSSTD